MFDYVKAELLRFRPWAIAYALLHLMVLGFLTRVVDLAQQPLFVYQCFAGVYVVSGLLLGAYQMGNYRKPNAWLNLLHRPIAHTRLAVALMLAAALLLALGVLLPMGLTAAWQEGMTARVVDQRHLWLCLSGWLLSLCGYLAGAYAMLAHRRYALAAFAFLLGLALAAALGLGAIALQLMALAWLAAMVLVSFKPDLLAAPRTLAATLVIAVPLQMALWFALLLSGFLVEIVWIVQGTHPNSLAVQVPGSAKEAENFDGRELMIAGLAASRHADAALWREQAAISDIHESRLNLTELPVRGELTNVAPMEFDDDTRHVRWVFSHDDLRFHGYGLAEQRAAGTLGLQGGHAFPQPPLPLGNAMLATGSAIYQYDEEAGRVLPRARVPHGEHIVGLGEAGDRISLLSQRALYLYDARDLKTGDGLLQPRLRVPVPGHAGMLGRVDQMELLDGVLVSFLFTQNVYRGQAGPIQVLVRVDEQGASTEVARRGLDPGYSTLYLYRNWWVSPLLCELQQRLLRLFAGGYRVEFDLPPRPLPPAVLAFAGALLLLSLALAAWRTQRLELSLPARLAWIATCGLVGLPALIALWLLYPPRERLADRPINIRSLRPGIAAALLLCVATAADAGAVAAPGTATDAASLRALVAEQGARARAPQLPRSHFLAQPMLREARLSPDGRAVAALVDDGRQRSLWLATADDPRGKRLLLRSTAEDMAFSRDGRWLFLVSPTQIYAQAMAKQAGSGAIAAVGGRSRREFMGVDPWRPAAVLLLERPPQASAPPKRWRLWRSEVGAKATLLHEGGLEVVDFAFAPDGALSHLLLAAGERHVIVHRQSRGGWRALGRCEATRRCMFIGTRNGGRSLVLRDNLDSDLMNLVQLDADGTRTTLHTDPRGEADLDGLVLDPRDNAPLIASYRSVVVGNYALQPEVQATLSALERRFPRSLLRLEVGRGPDARWLVRERGGALRGERLHLVDPRGGDAVEVFAQLGYVHERKPAPRLPEAAMARQLPVAWRASDGMLLHGFLWVPPGVDARRAPLVVSVHGGPFNLVRPDFSNGAQFLANRGYIVFAPNFRGSTGHGRRYLLASQGDFGGDGVVQRDIVEGTRWLLAQGIGDPGRVGITGASYGGYATLLGLSFQPELFKVGVAAVPPSDFAFVVREYLGSGKQLTPGVPMAATMRHLGVDPADRALMARLHAQSPVANVARMRRPLLILAGGEDDRVPIRGVTDYAARLRTLGVDVSLFVDAGAGHGMADTRTREAYLYLEEVLLHRHLGGAAAEPPAAPLRAHLKRNLRLASADLRP